MSRPGRTRGPHFFVPAGGLADETAVLTGDEARHLVSVLRARPGDEVSLADGTGVVAQARVVVAGDRVTLDVVERHTVAPSRPWVQVVHALPRGRKLDAVVAALSEVGVDGLTPVHSRRGQVRLPQARADRAVTRLRAVALAAAKQSRRAVPLQVEAVGDWATAFTGAPAGVVLWEEATTPLRTLAEGFAHAETVVLGVGPEGGLEDAEVAASGLPPASLGPTVLRTQTAAVVAAAIVLSSTGRLD